MGMFALVTSIGQVPVKPAVGQILDGAAKPILFQALELPGTIIFFHQLRCRIGQRSSLASPLHVRRNPKANSESS